MTLAIVEQVRIDDDRGIILFNDGVACHWDDGETLVYTSREGIWEEYIGNPNPSVYNHILGDAEGFDREATQEERDNYFKIRGFQSSQSRKWDVRDTIRNTLLNHGIDSRQAVTIAIRAMSALEKKGYL